MSPFDVLVLELFVPAASLVFIIGGICGSIAHAIVISILDAIEKRN